jgi:hypothetical protein
MIETENSGQFSQRQQVPRNTLLSRLLMHEITEYLISKQRTLSDSTYSPKFR